MKSYKTKEKTRSKSIGKAKAAGEDIQPLLDEVASLGDELDKAKAAFEEVQAKLEDLYLGLPNLLSDEVPEGKSEDDNVEVRKWGEPTQFDFEPKDHTEIGEGVAGIDFAASAKLSGSRFVVMRAGVAKIHRALIQLMLDTHN